tara:strand:+ start:1703 stop:2125 length:423 start_codon:yes stop_codon:yes gene_type:complete
MGINFKEVGAGSGDGFDALPEGRYNLTVENAEVTTASTGTEMIKVTFVVNDEKFKNRKLWHNFAMTQKSLIYLYNFLKAGGSSLLDEDDVDTPVIAKSMIGMKVSAFTEPGMTPNGNPKNDLSKWVAVEGGASSDTSLFE